MAYADDLFRAERQRPPISWALVSEAIDFYTEIGYRYVEVPWIISHEAKNTTFNKPSIFDLGVIGAMTGSAEQSIIDVILKSQPTTPPFPPLVMATPCFRDEEVYDELHSPSFFKVELFAFGDHVLRMTRDVKAFFSQHKLATRFGAVVPDVVPNTNAKNSIYEMDLVLGGIEVGSYGLREVNGALYSYGTGLAEPRYTSALRAYKRSQVP